MRFCQDDNDFIVIKYSCNEGAYQILMMRMIDPTALDEQYISVSVILQHLNGGHGHFAKRRFVPLYFFGTHVWHMAHRE